MSLNIPKTAIAFQGGAYGNYVKWILYSLLVPGELISPFAKSTSHNRSYINADHLQRGWVSSYHVTIEDLRKDNNYRLVGIHPKIRNNQTFAQALNNVGVTVDKMIVPYCDHATYLLGVNNYLFKIWQDTWNTALAYVDKQDLKQGWGIEFDDISEVPRWILREHHSMNVFNSWEAQCGWFAPAYYHRNNCQFVLLHDLFYNFLSTVESMRQHLDVEWVRDPEELLPFHRQNMHSQQYMNQDNIAKSILDSIQHNTNYTWRAEDITLYTEAYIQRRLQQLGIMLKCDGLNDFPTSTNALLEVCE